MKKKIILTTEQVNKIYEQNLDTDNVPTIDVDIDGANISSSEIAMQAKEKATNLGTDTYNLRIVPDTASQNGNNAELVGQGDSLVHKIEDFSNQYQNVPNKQNAVGMINVDSETMEESVSYSKAAVEEMRATNLKKSGKVMTIKEFNEYLKK